MKRIKMEKYIISRIQLFDYKELVQISADGDYEPRYSYSGNIIINDLFVVQLSTNGKINIPASAECYFSDEAAQDHAHENIDVDDVIEQTGLDVDREWLVENGAEIMNPENRPRGERNDDERINL